MAGLLVIVFLNIGLVQAKAIEQSRALVAVLTTHQAGAKMDDLIEAFRVALAYDSLGTTEVREQIASIALNIGSVERFNNDEKKKFIEFAVEELRKEISNSTPDVKHVVIGTK